MPVINTGIRPPQSGTSAALGALGQMLQGAFSGYQQGSALQGGLPQVGPVRSGGSLSALTTPPLMSLDHQPVDDGSNLLPDFSAPRGPNVIRVTQPQGQGGQGQQGAAGLDQVLRMLPALMG